MINRLLKMKKYVLEQILFDTGTYPVRSGWALFCFLDNKNLSAEKEITL